MSSPFFSSLLSELSTRAARSAISKLGFSNPPLRRHLLEEFTRDYGEPGCFLGDPVFEATFGWKQADTTMSALSKSLLHPDLVEAMDKPWGDNGKEYRFPSAGAPYAHQLAAWKVLLAPGYQSAVITSGTGSGKTECFMVPVLNCLAKACSEEKPLEGGVRALFLYPLNALIQSQRERLRAWTGPFNGDIRFCLYNGMTPEEAKAEKYKQAPHEVHDRSTLRTNPPAILVTNPTMLEYMLVRAQDAPILDKSQGKLKWIILDEAHNYVGSQAAELALLLRRVLHAFGTRSDRVHFVATSATIGSGDTEAKAKLQEFLARLAGVDKDRVTVVEGERQVPVINEAIDDQKSTDSAEFLAQVTDSENRYQRLSVHPVARRLRALFVPEESKQSYQSLPMIRSTLGALGRTPTDAEALAWLDLLTSAVKGEGRSATPFLPLRLHAFHNTLNGLWACANPGCSKKHGTQLFHEDWPFGMVYLAERRFCICGVPVFPLTSCNDCNETFLIAEISVREQISYLLPPLPKEVDEFMLDRDPEELDSEDEIEPEEEVPSGELRTPALIVNRVSRGNERWLGLEQSKLFENPHENALSIRIQDVEEVNRGFALRCPFCSGEGALHMQFRKPILSAPFLLGSIVPTLLEFCPDGENPLEAPMRGRRMMTFTDSRQGTARIAAQLQQEAERSAVRAAVYSKLVTETAESDGDREELTKEISFLKSISDDSKNPDLVKQANERCAIINKKLHSLSMGKEVTYKNMVTWLSNSAKDGPRIISFHANSDSSLKGPAGGELITQILLCREFARRPKRQNSLETIGMVSVQYPKLNAIKTRQPAVEQAGLTLDEWINFLKISLDFWVRQNFCLKVPAQWERWGGHRVFPRKILSPNSIEKPTAKLKRWPKVNKITRQNLLVRLLAYVLKVDPNSDKGRDRIDSLLLAAWDDLRETNLLQSDVGHGHYLDMEDMAFQNITTAWVCPVTRRVLDCTLRGVTPYLPSNQLHDGVAVCRLIKIPVRPVIALDHISMADRVNKTRAWVDAQEVLADARIEGVWSDINDRVVEGAGYFRAVEHSAQQAGSLLQDYEEQFKQGEINVMSCSTTMEMGVDIGGINMVTMNNVPPHPANYLQRAGRAGRRAETQSVALTLCKNNPHDQHVFHHTCWPFETRIPTPVLLLSSPLLVQRHINAMLLAHFLRRQDEKGKLDKLTLEWWMLPRGKSLQERFVAWCECFDPKQYPSLCEGLESLIKQTVFEGQSTLPQLVTEAGSAALKHAEHWGKELKAIDDQINLISKRDKADSIPLKALNIQLERLTGEYLLSELATSGFLPGYGFPTDITTFETLNKDVFTNQKNSDKSVSSREDNKYQRRELPSRDTVTALREYAPGASVVINGRVYESAGITLNWHVPAANDQINEIQNIRQAWRCHHCGASGTAVRADRIMHCSACGLDLIKKNQKEYLEPAGFSVDLYAETHNDITLQKYVPPEVPWITAKGEWMPLANPSLGRFRSSTDGSIFHYSSGLGGNGYALCLECGRAAPMGSADDEHIAPAIFSKPHHRLRGRRSDSEDWTCGGSDKPFKIIKNLHFGREYTTDVLELTLTGTDGNSLNDETVAYTIAVALRQAIANWLGIDAGELGCDSKPIRVAQGKYFRSIHIYDMRSAGYSSLVGPALPELLKSAQDLLKCENNCEKACQSCLLTYDTRFRVESLDRNAALKFFSDDWIRSLALPLNERLFGDKSKAEYQPLDEAITRELNCSGAKRLCVYLNGEAGDWDLPSSPIRRLLHRLSVKSGIELCAVTSQYDLSKLSKENASILSSLMTACSVTVRQGNAPALQLPGDCLASVESQSGDCYTWASQDNEAAHAGVAWGRHAIKPLIAALTSPPNLSEATIQLPVGTVDGLKAFDITMSWMAPEQALACDSGI